MRFKTQRRPATHANSLGPFPAALRPPRPFVSSQAPVQRVEATDRSQPERVTPRGHNFAEVAVGTSRIPVSIVHRASAPGAEQENRTGLPERLRAGIERLSGVSLEDVRVHYNSSRPGRIQALAYTQGTQIHVGPGQEENLAHEAWHIVQQKQGRVRSAMQLHGMGVNDESGLEREADVMGSRATGASIPMLSQTRQSAASAQPSAPQGAASHAGVIQARWMKVRGSGNPGHYYWDGRGEPIGAPPDGGVHVPAPPHQQMEDTHRGGSRGSMESLRTIPDNEWASLNNLAHFGSQAAQGKGIFYPGQTTQRGLGQQPVQTTIPHRDSGEHATIFSGMTGGERSSTQYQRSLGTAEPNTSYNILHGMGHGEGGKMTQSPQNLASASEGANTQMIPFDKAISGNPKVLVNTNFNLRPGTQRAESVHQSFSHVDYPHEPFFQQNIDGDLPKPTRGQYQQWKQQASRFSHPQTLEAALTMSHMSPPQSMEVDQDREAINALATMKQQQQSTWGRLGQWAPGSHPLDPRNGNSNNDDDDDMAI